MHVPTGAYVDSRNRFALVVPEDWTVVEPEKVRVELGGVRTDWKLAASLVSKRNRHAPTLTINVMDRPWSLTADARGIAEIERWLRAIWGPQTSSLEISTQIAEIDNFPAFHTSILATLPDQRRMCMDQYVVSPMRTYAIVAAQSGDRRQEAAAAALAIANGFRLLKWDEFPMTF